MKSGNRTDILGLGFPPFQQSFFGNHHFLISLTYHPSSGWNPKKVFPSPPKSQERIASKDLKGRR
jgi:hypothetical protein